MLVIVSDKFGLFQKSRKKKNRWPSNSFLFSSWLCCYMAQMNPLIGPKLSKGTILIMAREWGNPLDKWTVYNSRILYMYISCIYYFEESVYKIESNYLFKNFNKWKILFLMLKQWKEWNFCLKSKKFEKKKIISELYFTFLYEFFFLIKLKCILRY